MGAPVSTHPFINFQVDLRRVPEATWVLLGECSSKIEHISGVPLKPSVQVLLNQVFLAKGAHATTAIEGNTLSEEQVIQLINGNLRLPASMEYLAREVDNIVAGYNFIVAQIEGGVEMDLCADDLRRMNRMVLGGLDVGNDVVPGEFRAHTVAVGDYRSPPPEYSVVLVERLCSWMNDPVWNTLIGAKFVLPILKAIFAHLYIAWIHPFGDGNGRTARLVEYDILTRAGVPTASAHLLSDHYNRTRHAYYRALSAARSNPFEFVVYAVAGFVDGLREQIARVREQQIQVAWKDYVYEVFSTQPPTPASDRRRDLVLAVSLLKGVVPKAQLAELTPKLATLYDRQTPKTLTRDLNVVEQLELLAIEPRGVRARRELLRAFLPLVHPDHETSVYEELAPAA